MKPIKLTIKGLNSFQEEQVIAFDSLTKYGLFGVFGPTGSGKSTLLDGMTLALYGKTSRDSSNFINVQSDRAQISYEFCVSDKHYRVIRTYKRNAQGSINATKPTRIEAIDDDKVVILEEQTTQVDKKCLDIIGLEFKDFIRTVVLPQGKFSEFIQLKGRDRRDMLERLFDLSKYGDDLSRKLSAANRKEKDKHLEISGELKGFDNISTELEKELSLKLTELNETYNLKEKEFTFEEAKLKKLSEQYELSKSLNEINETLHELKLSEADINAKKAAVEEGQKILRVMPYYKRSQLLIEDEKKLSQLVADLNQQLEEKELELNNQKTVYSTFTEEHGEFFESFGVQKIKLEEKCELSKEYKAVKELITSITDKIKLLNIKKDEYQKGIHDDTAIESQVKDDLDALEKEAKLLHVPIEKQKAVDEGALLEDEYQKKSLEIKSLESKLQSDDITAKKDKLSELSGKLLDIEKALTDLSFTTEEDYLLEKQSILKNIEKVNELTESLHKKKEDLKNLKQELEELEKTKLETTVVYDKYISHKEKVFIHQLQEKLVDGMACPVCGSETHDVIETKLELDLDDSIEKTMQQVLVKYQSTKEKVEALDSELESLKTELSQLSLDTLNKKLDSLNDGYKSYKALIDKKTGFESESSTLTELLLLITKQYEENKKKKDELESDLASVSSRLGELKKLHTCEDFTEEKNIIYKRMKDYQEASKNMEMFREKQDLVQEKIKTTQSLLDEIVTSVKLEEQSLNQNNKILESLKGKVEDLDYDSLLKELIDKHNLLVEKDKTLKISLESSQEKFDQLVEKRRTNQVLLDKNREDYKSASKELTDNLILEGLNQENVDSSDWTVESVKGLSEEVESYLLKVHTLNNKKKELASKIDREVTDEMINSQNEVVNELKANFELLKKERIVVEKDLKLLRTQLETMKSLILKKEGIEYKLSLLKDLESLFKGKKFVEFVAAYHLRYISVEASERLFDITSGKYGLEVDDHGKFLIRDYSHGGELRDTSTLSGGESFLVSLSLALSLSSQIQLKGRAPLELFFLDEGFGTLDDRFLELVMTSLERIHHERLSIGLISHVDSIKNRVPIKLEVSPSIAGVRGSRIKVERS